MRAVFSFLLLCFFAPSAFAQRVYFFYLQTENNAPFYIKMDDKVIPATSGYLVLSNLKDSSYSFSVGFPSSRSEAKFNVPVSGKDRGFLIKNFDFGIGLFDLQSQAVVRSQVEEQSKNISYHPRNDDFTSLLAKAAEDSSLLFVAVVAREDVDKKEEPKKETVQTKPDDIKTDTETRNRTEVTTEVKQPDKATVSIKEDAIMVDSAAMGQKVEDKKPQDSAILVQHKEENKAVDSAMLQPPAEVYKRSVVKKHSESSTSEGFGLVFYDSQDGSVDTVRLIIPNPRFTLRSPDTTRAEDQTQFLEERRDTLRTPKADTEQKPTVKSYCSSIATDNDFFKLRKNMAGEVTDEGMVSQARKYFKTRCFSTEQIKNLGSLFLTSAGKYLFFEAAYLHVTDREQFAGLESELKDEYYLKRFKALIGQ